MRAITRRVATGAAAAVATTVLSFSLSAPHAHAAVATWHPHVASVSVHLTNHEAEELRFIPGGGALGLDLCIQVKTFVDTNREAMGHTLDLSSEGCIWVLVACASRVWTNVQVEFFVDNTWHCSKY